MDTEINPLLNEYNKRLNSSHVSMARGAKELLKTCIHEAGHWMAFAHYKIPVVHASVDRRSFIGSGRVIPTNPLGCVPLKMITEVEYIATLAGAYAQDALSPFVDRKINLATSMEDIRYAREMLDQAHGENLDTRKLFMKKCAPQLRQLIHQNWPIIEALAYELMAGGKFDCGQCRKVERRYGIGRYAFTPTRLKSAQEKLAAFHSSPATLLVALLATPS